MSFQVLVAIFSVLAVVIMAGLAYLDDMLLPRQVKKYNSVRYRALGLPFITDGRLWGSLFFLTPALYIICGYIDQFDAWLAITILFCCVVSFARQENRNQVREMNDALENGSTSPAGWVHAAYTAVVAAFVILFVLCCAPTVVDAITVVVLLALYFIARKIV